MDAITKSLTAILQRMKNTSSSQRLVVFLGGLLVAVSLFWLGQWAAQPEMVPLIPMDLQPEEIAQIRDGLAIIGEPHQVVGQRVLVQAAANRQALQAQLQLQGRMPDNLSAGFDALVKETNPWISQSENDRRWNNALRVELEGVLRQFEGVKSARVLLPISPPRRTFSRQPEEMTASVQLVMKNGRSVTRELALAAGRQVAGAVRGLSAKNVQVTDSNGVSVLESDEELGSAAAQNRERLRQEKLIADKIRAQIADPRARVSVQVELDLTTRSSRTDTPIEGVEQSVDTVEERQSRNQQGGQSGVEPNVGVVAGASASDNVQNKESSKRIYSTGKAVKVEDTPAGSITQVHAAINISHSYLVAILQRTLPDLTNPSEQQIQEVFDNEKRRLLNLLTKLVKPQKEEMVAIDWFYDADPTVTPVQAASTMEEWIELARKFGPQAGLGLLAILALFMMMRMGRSVSSGESLGMELGLPREAIAAARQAAQEGVGPISSGGGDYRNGGRGGASTGDDLLDSISVSPVGQAAVTEGVLVAQEVDEEAVQSHKMVEQVAQMIEQDPDAMSTLFEQWVRRGELT